MKQTEDYPKSIRKAIRYIKQDASEDQLNGIKKLIESAIERRKVLLK